MYRLARSLLFLLPAETAHLLGVWALSLLDGLPTVARLLRRRALRATAPSLRVSIAGLSFEHPIALAAGLDKDAEAIAGLFAVGFSAVEVGTVTPRPQPGNPTPRLFRLPEHQALINRMGFNNHGAAAAASRIRELRFRPGPVGVNIGKNKQTPLIEATADYLACARAVSEGADYLVINASSPNTPGLRQLQEPEALAQLLRAVRDQVPDKPLFLKIAPDLAPEAVDAIVDVALGCGIDGLVVTNTTLTRPLEDSAPADPKGAVAEAGGLSGAPLKALSTAVIRRAWARSSGRLPIIGVGGVFTAEDAYEKIRAGAAVVQIYTSFIYAGPSVVRNLVSGLAALLARDGLGSVGDAVGADAISSRSPPAAQR